MTIPIRFSRSDILLIGIVSPPRGDGIEARTMVPTTRPMGIAGSPPTVDLGDPMVVTGEDVDSMVVRISVAAAVVGFHHLRHLPHQHTFIHE